KQSMPLPARPYTSTSGANIPQRRSSRCLSTSDKSRDAINRVLLYFEHPQTEGRFQLMAKLNHPANLKYSKTDEWVRVDGDEATVGITDYAQDQLGDIVYVELP